MAYMHPFICLERRDRLVVEISGDFAGTSFGRQVDSGPSLCKICVVKNVCNRLRLSCTYTAT
eukprot:scaffold395730_cov31-Attheya_sp.AAC.1